MALSDISLQCNDLSLSGQSELSRLVYPGEFMSSRPRHQIAKSEFGFGKLIGAANFENCRLDAGR